MRKISFIKLSLLALFLVFSCGLAAAQTNEFTYQGKLTNSGMPSSGTYDFEFRLCELDQSGCVQLQRKERLGVQVTGGIFTVNLDFDAELFNGVDRFLIIGVRRNSSEPWIQLSPQQKITSAPYAIKSLKADRADIAINSFELGAIPANQYVLTNDARLSDERNPLPNSGNYIQNNPLMQQPSSSFNIGGNGTAGGTLSGNIVNAATQFNLGGSRILSRPGFLNLFAGTGAGAANAGSENSFFGNVAGISNTTGNGNAFFGSGASTSNTTGSNNSTLGGDAGKGNTTGSGNLFLGSNAGASNTVESNNSFIGASSNGVAGITNATALGYRARVTQSNSLILGSISGVNGADADTRVGIGTTAPQAKLHVGDGAILLDNNRGLFLRDTAGMQKRAVIGDSSNILRFGSGGPTGFDEIRFDVSTSGETMTIKGNGNVGIGTILPSAKLHVESAGLNKFMIGSAAAPKFLVRDDFVNIGAGSFYPDPGLRLVVGGIIQTQVATSGFVPLCWSAQEYIATCSSSLRYKENVHDFSSGLDLLRRLRPVSFNWKANATADLGLVAEEVNEIEPRLIIHNKQGEIEGVKYDRVGVVLINAVKEQQTLIERQQQQIESQQQQIEAMKKLVCELKPEAAICREK